MPARERVQVHPAAAAARPWALCAIHREVAAGGEAVASQVHANTWGCVNVVVRGQVRCGDGVLPARFLTGPFSAPFATRAEGPLASLSIVLAPWLLQPLFGLPVAAMVDRLVDADVAGSPVLQALCALAARACDDGDLAPLWSFLADRAAQAGAVEPELALDVLRGEGVEAAARACGWSARHYRRRFAAAMGLAPAAWIRIARWEASLLSLAQESPATAPLAAVSALRGYADQAHLARDTRTFTGTTPAQLRRALHAGAGHWSLRPALVRSVQDAREGGA